MSSYLNRILTGDAYQKFRKETKAIIESIPMVGGPMRKLAQKMEEHLKGFFLPGIVFEELGFTYVGPIDGHNMEVLVDTFKNIKNNSTPTLVHVITQKGKGYEFSEKDPSHFHGTGPFETETGEPSSDKINMTYSEVFGAKLTELAGKDSRIVAITAAMKEGTGLRGFAEKFPDRFYDVGIAEPHAATFAAGLASQGMRPVVAIYSTFLQRAYDEIIHDICLQDLPVVFAIDRGGLVGDDGPTHHGVYDLSYLRHIPNLVVMAPKDHTEFSEMLSLALRLDGPVAIRFPRAKISEAGPSGRFAIGQSETLKEGADLAILAIGNTVMPSLRTASRLEAEGVNASVFNMRFLKPIDETAIKAAAATGRILTVEENASQGGFGSAVLEVLQRLGIKDVEVRVLGIPDEFIEHGTQAELRRLCGIDEEGIFATALSMCKAPNNLPAR
jgi:1-deoxy-D-xylulose-5-phosphate synthase